MNPLLHDLRALLGAQALLEPGAQDLGAYERDWRGRYCGRALAVALPADTQQVSALVRLCAQQRVPIVPQGGNTGLTGASTPDESGRALVVSLKRMNRIRAQDSSNASLTAEAGCTLAEVQAAARAMDLRFPLSLAAEQSCTIGGNLATNAGGIHALRFGTARALCLGLEAVLADGSVLSGLRALRKDNAGYDWRDLLIGSEGTLGIITAASLQLSEQPRAVLAAWLAVADLSTALLWLTRARQQFGAALTAFEVMSAACLQLVQQQEGLTAPQEAAPGAWHVLLSIESQRSREEALENLSELFGDAVQIGIAQSAAQERQLWQLREAIPLAERRSGAAVKHDISLPLSALPEFVREADAQLHAAFPSARIFCFGHLGDGNLHYNLAAPPGTDANAFVRAHEAQANAIVYEIVQRMGGSFAAEHGIGVLKRAYLAAQRPAEAALMRAIKAALDPLDILNPGRVV